MIHTQRFKNNLQDILTCIVNKGMTTDEICKECNMNRTTFRNYLQHLREKRMIYICEYRKVPGVNRPMAVYKFGCGEDVEFIHSKNYTPKRKAEPTTVVPKTPRCDIAAQWMLNPITEDVCQS